MFGKLKSILPLATVMFFTFTIVTWAQQPEKPATKPADPQSTKQQPEKMDKPKKEQTDQSKKVQSINANDRKFMTETANGGMAEVALGQMALSQAANEDVKKFAQRMVDDHSKANQELTDLAKNKGVSLPAEPGPKHKQVKDRLAKLSKADFDREYMKEMVKDHQKTVSTFELRSRQARNAELKAWVDKTLPTLREHLQMARDVAKKVGAAGTAASSTGL